MTVQSHIHAPDNVQAKPIRSSAFAVALRVCELATLPHISD